MKQQSQVLVINSGSSSIKFAIFNQYQKKPVASGLAERINSPEASLTLRTGEKELSSRISGYDHRQAMQAAIDLLFEHGQLQQKPVGIGHRVVHGGEQFTRSQVIDEEVLAGIKKCTSLAPLHNPANVTGIEILSSIFPQCPQVAVFDTAFHQTLPPYAYTYGLPYSLYQDLGVRKYGFHGTSHRYITLESARILDKPLSRLNILSLHLGNGCSACAVRAGKSVDTTMGLTPLEGLLMGTRSGDIDPGIFQYLLDSGYTTEAIHRLLNKESGLLGISGLSNDMRTLLEAAPENQRARLAIDVFCYRLAKQIAALYITLPYIDGIVFTGGIGEHAAAVRDQVAAQLAPLGIKLDEELNQRHGKSSEFVISASGSEIPVLVIPTDEEWLIAQDTFDLTVN